MSEPCPSCSSTATVDKECPFVLALDEQGYEICHGEDRQSCEHAVTMFLRNRELPGGRESITFLEFPTKVCECCGRALP